MEEEEQKEAALNMTDLPNSPKIKKFGILKATPFMTNHS